MAHKSPPSGTLHQPVIRSLSEIGASTATVSVGFRVFSKGTRLKTRILSLAVALMALGVSAWGQLDQGRITGLVIDSSNSPIPGVKIVARNEKTGVERTAETTATGQYLLPNLPAASYTITASSTGLGDSEFEHVIVGPGQERALNITMQPASVKQEVNVSSGDLAALDTSSARIGVNVSEREVANLPLNGRQISQLYLLTPGATNAGSGTFDDIRFSGRSNEQNAIRYDGIEGSAIIDTNPGNLNGESTSLFRLESSLENVQEFRVESNNFPAEYGTGTGGQITIITKSGSNDLHGSGFFYIRNNALDARNFFSRQVDVLKLNQFGGSLGGAIIKNKLFVFGSYEQLRQRTQSPFVDATLSDVARGLKPRPDGTFVQLDPGIKLLLNAFPRGTTPTANPLFDLTSVNAPGRIDEYYGGIRLDYNPNDKIRTYLRVFRDEGFSSFAQNSTLSQFVTAINPQNAVLTVSQTLTPTILNETKIGYNGAKSRVAAIPGPSPDISLAGTTINISGVGTLQGIAGQGQGGGIAIPSGLIRLSSSFNGRGAPYTPYTYSFIDNLSWLKGNHNFKFGGEVRPVRLYNDQQGGSTYTFNSIDDFLANKVANIQFRGDISLKSPWTGLSGNLFLKQAYYVFYAQDEWHINPELTMSYGLRYEYYTPLKEVRNKNVFFDTTNGSINPLYTKDWYSSSKLNFGPRLSFAYAPARLGGKTVFRIGAGYYYGPGQTEDQLQPAANDVISRTISNVKFPYDTASIVSGYDINSPTLGYQPRAYASGYQIPEKILQYTFSVQQQLPGSAVLTVAYVGSQGRNLFQRGVTNLITGVTTAPSGAVTVNRQFGNRVAEIDYKTSGGTSHYNSLQTTVNRRFAKGLTIAGQWTYAHDIGNTGGSNAAATAGNNYSFATERGNNSFDIRHTVNVSALYELPFGKGRRFGSSVNNLTEAFLGGWQIGGIVNARTGLPIDVLITRADVVCQQTGTGIYYSLSGGACRAGDTGVVNVPGGGASRNVRRPDLVPGVNPYLKTGKTIWLNPAAFTVPTPGRIGNLGRNALRGPGTSQLDITLSKKFHLTEKVNLEFRSELYNIFNKANFANPGNLRFADALPSNPTALTGRLQPGIPYASSNAGGNWGLLNSTVSNLIGQGTARQIQLSLRLAF